MKTWEEIYADVKSAIDAAVDDCDSAEINRRLGIIRLEVEINQKSIDILSALGIDPNGSELDLAEGFARALVKAKAVP